MNTYYETLEDIRGVVLRAGFRDLKACLWPPITKSLGDIDGAVLPAGCRTVVTGMCDAATLDRGVP